jgi:hypothetical protein
MEDPVRGITENRLRVEPMLLPKFPKVPKLLKDPDGAGACICMFDGMERICDNRLVVFGLHEDRFGIF